MRNDPRIITAKFNSVCKETGKAIKKGDSVAYYPLEKSVFCEDSKTFKDCLEFLADIDNGY